MDSDGDGQAGWDSDSVKTVEDCSEDDSDLDQEAALSLVPFPQNAVRFEPAPRIEVAIPKKTVSPVMDADTDPVSPKRAPLPDVQVRAVQTPITQLVQHLRKDNERLQQLLVDAQREAEEALQRGQDKGNVDYAHLLDLAKEFSTSIGDDVGLDMQGFRMDADDMDEKDLKIKKLKAEIADVKDKLAMRQSSAKSHHQKQKRKKKGSEEIVGYWISSKTSALHFVIESGCGKDVDASTATKWQVTEIKTASLTLQNSNGMEHTVERLKTKMFGESLLWGSGDLWTKKLDA
eukprot:gnl/MRDRNA2_/MRDRNA2_103614_c0_seq1.p1 gnl/MRDRNA2_/MRDRNA2_103614_c0~~gnl/MRDRNA2_/MRDRNA2_103614_c0_seq1.p1  ORF type:complete len:290 (-),score=67.85 gnl/MRDRNA2_/MRDRNA2_103614_c0_seq1:112-981(-)